jgi:hypothetical protein
MFYNYRDIERKTRRAKHLFFDLETDVYYSQGESHVYFYHFNNSEDQRLKKIDNLPPVNQIIYHHFIDGYGETPLVWFTTNSAVILRSCGKHFVIPGEYNESCTVSFIQLLEDRPTLCFLNRNTSTIDIFEWKYGQDMHIYRRLAHLQLDQPITHCACCIGSYIV